MTTHRVNFKWNINELISLQREYELLEMTVQEIAARHGRGVDGIIAKLEKEGFIETKASASARGSLSPVPEKRVLRRRR